MPNSATSQHSSGMGEFGGVGGPRRSLSFPFPTRLPVHPTSATLSESRPPSNHSNNNSDFAPPSVSRSLTGSNWSRSASESEAQPLPHSSSGELPNPAGIRKISEPALSRPESTIDIIYDDAEGTGTTTAELRLEGPIDFTSRPDPTFVDPFDSPYVKEQPFTKTDFSPKSAPRRFTQSMIEYDSQEDSPHTMTSATSSSSSGSGSSGSRPSVDTLHSEARPGQSIRGNRPKSLLSRLLRHPNEGDFEPVNIPRSASTSGQYKHNDGRMMSTSKASKRKSSSDNGSRWTKKASRKPPPPPMNASSPDEEASLAGLGLSLSRQSGSERSKGIASPKGRVRGKGSISMWSDAFDEEEEEEFSWERVGSLPRVCLFPPEEELSEPITLYPPPPPPHLTRPPLLQMAPPNMREKDVERSSSRSSLYAVTAGSSGSTGNIWGGMSGGFTKPPPVFKRSPKRGSTVPSGVVLPKRREQYEQETSWRLSLTQSELPDFSNGVPMSPPSMVTPMSPPIRQNIDSEPSSPPVPPKFQKQHRSSMEMTSGLQELGRDHGNNGTSVQHETEIIAPIPRPNSTPPREIRNEDMPLRSASAPPEVDFGASPPPLVLSNPNSSLQDRPHIDGKEAVEEKTIIAGPLTESPPTFDQPLPAVPSTSIDSLPKETRGEPAGIPASSSLSKLRRSSEETRSTVTTSDATNNSKTGKMSRNRRSLSFSSGLSFKAKEVAPPVPISSSSVPVPPQKVVKKQRSLKNMFFSSDHLSRTASGDNVPAMPKLDKDKARLAKEKEKQAAKEKDKAATKEKEFVKARVKMEKEMEKVREQASKSKAKDEERSYRGILSKKSSKPSLKIDVKATKGDIPPVPSLPPMPHSAPTTASSSSTSAFPETPIYRSASRDTPRTGRRSPPPSTSTSTSTEGRGLTKRFSLTNMSGAFKRSKKNLASVANGTNGKNKENIPVPQVPDLPDMYKQEKMAKGKQWHGFGRHNQSKQRLSSPPAPSVESMPEVPKPKQEVVRTSAVPIPMRGPEGRAQPRQRMVSLPSVEFGGMSGSFLTKEEEAAYLSPPTSPQVDLNAKPETSSASPAWSLTFTEEFDRALAGAETLPSIPSIHSSESPNTQALDLATATSNLRARPASLARISHGSKLSGSSLSSFKMKASPSGMTDAGSILSDSSSTFELEQELKQAQLVLVSPKTRKNPTYSLQSIIGITPGLRTSTVVPGTLNKRRSVEAVVVGPLLPSPPIINGNEVPNPLESSTVLDTPTIAEEPESVEGDHSGHSIATGANFQHLIDSPASPEIDRDPTPTPSNPHGLTGEEDLGTVHTVVKVQRQGPSNSGSEASLTSLDSLSRSSTSSEPSDPPCATPASPNSESLHYPLPIATAMNTPGYGNQAHSSDLDDISEMEDHESIQRGDNVSITDTDEQSRHPLLNESPRDEVDHDELEAEIEAMRLKMIPSKESEASDLVMVDMETESVNQSFESPIIRQNITAAGRKFDSPGMASTSTLSPKSTRWSPGTSPVFRFFSHTSSDKGSPRSIISRATRAKSPKTQLPPAPEHGTPKTIDHVNQVASRRISSLQDDKPRSNSMSSLGSSPIPPPKDNFKTLDREVQLKSLYFDSLEIDFDGLNWADSRGLGMDGLDESAIEEVV